MRDPSCFYISRRKERLQYKFPTDFVQLKCRTIFTMLLLFDTISFDLSLMRYHDRLPSNHKSSLLFQALWYVVENI